MTSTGPAGLRALRAGVFGTVVLLLAALSHLAAGGPLPSLAVLLMVGLPVACAAAVLARRTRRLPSLVAALAAAQVVLHETFMSTGTAACAPGHGHAGASHHATTVTCEAMPTASHAPSVLMLALHAVAVLATAALLAHGERIAVRLALWARGALTGLVLPAVPAPGRPTLVRLTTGWCAPLRAATDVSRRGPPARPALVHVTA